MNIYDRDGWLDTVHIQEVADRNNIAFIMIVGKRQVGKTYNVLKLMLDQDKRFILLRGMSTEFDMLKKNVNSPFEGIHGYENQIFFEHGNTYTADIIRLDENEEKKTIGMLAFLSGIGRVRGINGSIYSDVVYDECIPESHLLKVRDGDNAFLNMYTTFAGNRELEGKPPLRCWCIANSNDFNADIFKALDITDIVERMTLRGEESRIIKDRGIMILLPESKQIIEKRKQTALYRAIRGDSKFARMAYENEFSFNDYTDVRPAPIGEYNLLITVGEISVHVHKSDYSVYITTKSKAQPRHYYSESDYGFRTFVKDYPELKAAYQRGKLIFQSMTVKSYFLNIVEKF